MCLAPPALQHARARDNADYRGGKEQGKGPGRGRGAAADRVRFRSPRGAIPSSASRRERRSVSPMPVHSGSRATGGDGAGAAGGTESDARGCLSQTPLSRDALNNVKKEEKELPDSARKVDKTQKLSAIQNGNSQCPNHHQSHHILYALRCSRATLSDRRPPLWFAASGASGHASAHGGFQRRQ